ncbi:hypothetical protein FQZ97_1062460 [compost metagenome]
MERGCQDSPSKFRHLPQLCIGLGHKPQGHVVPVGARHHPLVRRRAEDSRDQQDFEAFLLGLVWAQEHTAETCIEQMACALDEAIPVLALAAGRNGDDFQRCAQALFEGGLDAVDEVANQASAPP